MSQPPDIDALAAAVGLEPAELRRGDVERRVGTPHEEMVRWWRAMGFAEVPEDVVSFGEDDVRMATALDALLRSGTIGDREVLRLARVLGASFSRIAEAQVALLDDLATAGPGDDGAAADGGVPIADEAAILDLLQDAVVYVWRRHLLAALGRRMPIDADADPDAVASTTVGFVDISGFSKLSKRLGIDELADVVDAFEAAALDAVAARSGRVVKFIGDAVMFVAPDLVTGVEIGLDLLASASSAPDDASLPGGGVELHCGVAEGPTVTVGGDVFGSTVNLASRLTDIARRNTVVVTREAAESLMDRDDLVVRRIRRTYDLKGVGRTRVATITRRPPPEEPPEPPELPEPVF